MKPKRCKWCRKELNQRNSFQSCCKVECAIAWAQNEGRKADYKRQREESRQLKLRNESVTDLYHKARVEFQKWIRNRDTGLGCISCGTTLLDPRHFHAGHYYPADSNKELVFNEDNVHGQCIKCNNHLSGNQLAYRDGLVGRIGPEALDRLDQAKRDQDSRYKEFTKEELREIRKEYSKRNKGK